MKCIFSRRTNFALTLWKILLWWFWWKDLIWMLTITLISQGSGSLFTFLQNPILLWEVPYLTLLRAVWDNVFKNRSSKICGNQPLKNLKQTYLSRPHHFKIFKDSLPQILRGPFLNTLSLWRLVPHMNTWSFFRCRQEIAHWCR